MSSDGLNFKLEGVLETSRELGVLARKLPTIQKRSIATLRRRLPVQARRDIQQEYNIGAARLRKDLGTSFLADGVRITGRFRGIGLRSFGGRQTRQGVTSQVLRGKRSLDPGAFIARLLGGGEQAVERGGEKRVMTKGRYVGKRRQPLYVLYGATAAQMLRKGRRPERLVDYARGLLRGEVDRQLQALARKQTTTGA